MKQFRPIKTKQHNVVRLLSAINSPYAQRVPHSQPSTSIRTKIIPQILKFQNSIQPYLAHCTIIHSHPDDITPFFTGTLLPIIPSIHPMGRVPVPVHRGVVADVGCWPGSIDRPSLRATISREKAFVFMKSIYYIHFRFVLTMASYLSLL